MAHRRRRAPAAPGNDVADQRYELYSHVWSCMKQAIAVGFFREALALVESVVADRLESRLAYLRRSAFGFKTLGQLIEKVGRVESDRLLPDAVTSELKTWRAGRNTAVHEMVKIVWEPRRWSGRYAECEQIAQEGLRLLRVIGGHVNQLQDLGR